MLMKMVVVCTEFLHSKIYVETPFPNVTVGDTDIKELIKVK